MASGCRCRLGFRGGKGVATALGILLALQPWLGVAALATWLGVFLLFRISSLSAILAGALAPLYAWLMLESVVLTVGVGLMSVLLLWRHKDNIGRLLSGAEGRVGGGKEAAALTAARLYLPSSGKVTIGGLIDRLEKSGLVRREADATDRRVNRVFLQPRSKQLIAKMRRVSHQMNEVILKGLQHDDLETFAGTLEGMKRNLLDYLNSSDP